jgi:hemerythrin
MALFLWKEEYTVDIKQIDDQHKQLVEMINELHSAMLSGKGREALGETFTGLVEYTKTHFSTEETLMSQHGYPELKAHRESHDEFTNKVTAMYNDFTEGNILISIELMNFLKDWLINHIARVDKKYAPFFSEKGIQ